MNIQNLMKTGVLAGLVAAVVNSVIFYASTYAGSISQTTLLPDGKPLGIISVIVSSVLPGLVAGLFLYGISKFSKNPIRIFTNVSYVFLLISLIGPISAPNLAMGMRITLIFMHLVAGITIITQLKKVTN